MTPRTADTRPIRRAPKTPPLGLPPGTARLMESLRPWRHQLRPGSAAVLASVELADLHDVRDAGLLEDLVGRRLALPESRRHLIGPFDVRDRVGPARDGLPADRPMASPALRPLTGPPSGLEAMR